MSLYRKFFKISFILLTSSSALMPLNAANPKNSKTAKKNPKTNSVLAPKKVQIEQTSQNIEMTTNDGSSVALPAVNQKLIEQASLLPTSDNLIAGAGFIKSLASLQEQLVIKKEVEELSDILGVHISDISMLDFYREVASWLGTRYRRGGMSRQAVDCSGFTGLIYKTVFGQEIERVSTAIAKNLKEPVTKDDLQPGDMVFFSTFGKKYINHVGLYLGDGKFIHASIKKGVVVSRLDEGYYSKTYRKGGRN